MWLTESVALSELGVFFLFLGVLCTLSYLLTYLTISLFNYVELVYVWDYITMVHVSLLFSLILLIIMESTVQWYQ